MKDEEKSIINFLVSWGSGFLYLYAVMFGNFGHWERKGDMAHSNAWDRENGFTPQLQEPLAERIFYDSGNWFTLLIPIAMVIIISSQIKARFGANHRGEAEAIQVRTSSPAIHPAYLVAGAIIWPGLFFTFAPGFFVFGGGLWVSILGAVLLLFTALFNEHKMAAETQIRTSAPAKPAAFLIVCIVLGLVVGNWPMIVFFALMFFLVCFNESKVAEEKQIRTSASAKPAASLIVSAIIWNGFIEPWGYALIREKTRPDNSFVYNSWEWNETMLIALGSGLVLFIASFPIYGPIVFRAVRELFKFLRARPS